MLAFRNPPDVLRRRGLRVAFVEFLDFLRQIERTTPLDLDLHLVLDNSTKHKAAKVREWLEAHLRFRLHFTPTINSRAPQKRRR